MCHGRRWSGVGRRWFILRFRADEDEVEYVRFEDVICVFLRGFGEVIMETQCDA